MDKKEIYLKPIDFSLDEVENTSYTNFVGSNIDSTGTAEER